MLYEVITVLVDEGGVPRAVVEGFSMRRVSAAAVAETLRLSERLAFSLDELRYEYPGETREGFATPQEALVHFTYEGASYNFV